MRKLGSCGMSFSFCCVQTATPVAIPLHGEVRMLVCGGKEARFVRGQEEEVRKSVVRMREFDVVRVKAERAGAVPVLAMFDDSFGTA